MEDHGEKPSSLKGEGLVERLLTPMQQSLIHPPSHTLNHNIEAGHHHVPTGMQHTAVHQLIFPADFNVSHENNQNHHLPVLSTITATPQSLTSPPMTGRLLKSPPPELSGEPYIIYENAQMIAELETKLIMVYHPLSYTVEISCIILGVQEGNCLHLYLDYKALYAALLQPEMVSKFKKRRRNVAIEFLLGRLTIERDISDLNNWTLTLDNPKNIRDRRYFSQTASIVGNESSSSVHINVRHGSQAPNDSRKSSMIPPKSSDTGETASVPSDADELLKFRKDKMLDDRLRADLKRLIREKPIDLVPFDTHGFYLEKRYVYRLFIFYDVVLRFFTYSNGKPASTVDLMYDLPLLPNALIKVPNGISNLLGKVWLGAKDLEADIAVSSVPESLGENNTFTKTNILMEYLENKKSMAPVMSPTSAASSTVVLPKIELKSPLEPVVSAPVTSHPLSAILSPKSQSDDPNERHVYDFLSSTGNVLPPLKSPNSSTDEAARSRFKMFGSLLFNKSSDSHTDTATMSSVSSAPSFDGIDASGESGSGKSGRMRRRTLNSTPLEKPKATIKYNYGVNSLAALTIDEQEDSPNILKDDTSRTHRRTFGMDPLPLPSHFSTPGGSALAAAALNPFHWKKRAPGTASSRSDSVVSVTTVSHG